MIHEFHVAVDPLPTRPGEAHHSGQAKELPLPEAQIGAFVGHLMDAVPDPEKGLRQKQKPVENSEPRNGTFVGYLWDIYGYLWDIYVK